MTRKEILECKSKTETEEKQIKEGYGKCRNSEEETFN